MAYVRRLREVMGVYISAFLHSERTEFQQPSAYVAAAVMCLRRKDRLVCQTRTEGFHSKCRGEFVNVILHYFSEMLHNLFYFFFFNISTRITVNRFMNFISWSIGSLGSAVLCWVKE
jgi:hypothetical protein